MLVLAVPVSLFVLGALLFLSVRLDVMQTRLAERQATRTSRLAAAPRRPAIAEVVRAD